MTVALLTIIALVAGVTLIVAGGVLWFMNRTRHYEHDETGALPLFGGLSEVEAVPADAAGVMAGGAVRLHPRPPSPVHPMRAVEYAPPAERSGNAVARPSPKASPTIQSELSSKANPTIKSDHSIQANPTASSFATTKPKGSPTIESGRTSVTSLTAPTEPAPTPVFGHGVPGTMVEGQLVRFSVPQEGTLQFLPGRLEIGAGMDSGREIRFVRVPGPKGTEVTFGRSEGELYRHIQLRDQTVSRSHARMRLSEGHWYLRNLSKTNPIVHNGRVLPGGNEYLLTDGDRIEMGEVLFTFRSR